MRRPDPALVRLRVGETLELGRAVGMRAALRRLARGNHMALVQPMTRKLPLAVYYNSRRLFRLPGESWRARLLSWIYRACSFKNADEGVATSGLPEVPLVLLLVVYLVSLEVALEVAPLWLVAIAVILPVVLVGF